MHTFYAGDFKHITLLHWRNTMQCWSLSTLCTYVISGVLRYLTGVTLGGADDNLDYGNNYAILKKPFVLFHTYLIA